MRQATGGARRVDRTDLPEPATADAVLPESEGLFLPYRSAWEHLHDELRRLDLRLGWRARRPGRPRAEGPLDRFKGLVISDEEFAALVDDLAGPEPDGPEDPAGEGWGAALSALDEQIRGRLAASARENRPLPLAQLGRIFRLTAFERQCLIICLAPELDPRYEKVYAYLQDDVTRRRPSISLVLDLLCGGGADRLLARTAFDPRAPLMRYRLCRTAEDDTVPLLSRSLRLDDRVVDFLSTRRRPDARLDAFIEVRPWDPDARPPVADESQRRTLQELLETQGGEEEGRARSVVLHLFGPRGSGKRALVERLTHDLGAALIVADLERMLADSLPFGEAIGLVAREAILLPAALCLQNVDALLADPGRGRHHFQSLLEAVRLCSRLTFLIGRGNGLPEVPLGDQPFFSVEVTPPEIEVGRRLWESQAGSQDEFAADVDWDALATRFQLGPSQIRDALGVARNLARARTPPGSRVAMADLLQASRMLAGPGLTSLARKVDTRQAWDDLVLPEDQAGMLRELCDQARNQQVVLGEWGFRQKMTLGRGLTALFSGPPGTGKTMAAQLVAGHLQRDLYKIDLSQMVSKYIGDTEKNLRRVFDEAQASHAILFFDEADALFGKRSDVKDAHDRYANIETGYLLQKMEEYEGMAILATNLRQNMDEAFVRRLRFIVEFPFPDEEQRRRIWEVTFPRDAPVASDVDFRALARQVRLAGGHIRNIGLAAAFYAAADGGVIRMEYLQRAAAREYQKLGRSWNEGAEVRANPQEKAPCR